MHVKISYKSIERPNKNIYPSVFNNAEVRTEIHRLHDQYVLVPAYMAGNNVVFVCNAHYINCILEELGFNSICGNPTYTQGSLSMQEIIQNHKSVLDIFKYSRLSKRNLLTVLTLDPEASQKPLQTKMYTV